MKTNSVLNQTVDNNSTPKIIDNRFIIVDFSVSAHCCFTHSIVDTSKGQTNGFWNDVICECFTEEDAVLILEAVNKHISQ